MSTVSSKSSAHVFILPYPAPGHIIPILDLTHQLLTRGLTITILVAPTTLSLVEPLLSNYPSSLKHLLLPFPQLPSTTKFRPIAYMRSMQQLFDPIIQWFQSHTSPPVAIISDSLLGGTHLLTSMLGVPRVIFSSSGAFEFSISSKIWQDIPKGDNNPSDENSLISFPKIPNSPNYPWWQECFKNSMLANLDEWGILINSFSVLEGVYLDPLKRELGHDKVRAVGPLLPTKDDLVGPVQRGGSHSCQKVMTWLDKRTNGSVVYVCFGSRVVPTRKQMNELATALECIGVQFIWCVCDGHVGGDYGVVSNGFEDRWVPQVAILRHRAVGTFLTHCGWNSVLEGLSAGVVMLTWPINGDQFTNAKLLVDQLGVSIRVGVGGGSDNVPNSAELGRLLAKSVDENDTLPETDRAMRMRDAALSAVTGNSKRDLDEFVGRLHNKLNDFFFFFLI
ncbi:UDP-glycosyltransferase 89B2 [Fagus crenata]